MKYIVREIPYAGLWAYEIYLVVNKVDGDESAELIKAWPDVMDTTLEVRRVLEILHGTVK